MTMVRPINHDFAGEATLLEQRRSEEQALDLKNKKLPVFMFLGYGFRPEYSRQGNIGMRGPLCPCQITKDRPCLAELRGTPTESTAATCEVCGANLTMPHHFQRFREIAHTAYKGYLNYIESGNEIVTLDVPYDAIKERSENETRTIEIKWSQKDGRNQAVIYFIDRNDKSGKVQVFADLERSELRHDGGDHNPGKMLAKITATFKNAKSTIEYPETTEVVEEN